MASGADLLGEVAERDHRVQHDRLAPARRRQPRAVAQRRGVARAGEGGIVDVDGLGRLA
jgi:hypothetical protein